MDCSLCLEVQGKPHPQHLDYGQIVKARKHILYESDGVVCVPSLGPLNSYHLLIVPKIHYTSIASINKEALIEEFETIKSRLISYNQSKHGLHTAFFEHGTGTKADVACACIEHAHLHALGTNVDLLTILIQMYGFKSIKSTDVYSNNELSEPGYYYYEHTLSKAIVCTQMLEPQFFRIIYWHAFGQWSPWNWRLYRNFSLIQDVIANYDGL